MEMAVYLDMAALRRGEKPAARYAFMHHGGCECVAFYIDRVPEFDELLLNGDEIMCCTCGREVLDAFGRVPREFLVRVQ